MDLRYPWDSKPAPAEAPSLPDAAPAPPRRRGRRPVADRPAATADPAGWLYHHLTVSGPADTLAAFAAAARGAGVVPWQLDTARIEEDVFNLAAAQPAASRHL